MASIHSLDMNLKSHQNFQLNMELYNDLIVLNIKYKIEPMEAYIADQSKMSSV